MHRAGVLMLAVAVAGLVIGVSPALGLDEPEVIRLVDVEEAFVPIDREAFTDEDVPVVGARFAPTDGLYEWAGAKRGKRAGRLEGLCTFTVVKLAAGVATAYCTAEVSLRRGRVLVAGFIRFREEGAGTFVIPVVGGTGRYANARGTFTLRELRGGNSAATFRLVP
jgi:hypothetical protein